MNNDKRRAPNATLAAATHPISTEPQIMLRWLIATLILANIAAFAAFSAAPTPASGRRDSAPLDRQIHPERLSVRPISPSESADVPVVGGPVATPDVQASALPQ